MNGTEHGIARVIIPVKNWLISGPIDRWRFPPRDHVLLARIENPTNDVLVLLDCIIHTLYLDEPGVQPQKARCSSGAVTCCLHVEDPIFLRLKNDNLFIVQGNRDLCALPVDTFHSSITAPVRVVHVAHTDAAQSLSTLLLTIKESTFCIFAVHDLGDLKQEVECREGELTRAAVDDADPVHELIFFARERTSREFLRHSQEILGETGGLILRVRAGDGLEEHLRHVGLGEDILLRLDDAFL